MKDNDAFLNPHKHKTTYRDGEQPTAQKMTASETERANAMYLLERAVGAMHRAVDSLPAPNMVSLARTIGNTANIEPPLGGFEGSPENPQLAYMLRDATYNTIPNPEQVTTYDPELDGDGSTGVHIMCEVGCIHDTMGHSEWPKRCRKGYLDVNEAGGSNYKQVCGNITTVEGLRGVCQNTACPDWSGKPMQVSYPDSDADSGSGTVKDVLRRYKIVFPKESRLVDRPAIRDYIDCGTASGEGRRHDSDTGGIGVTQIASVKADETFGKQTSGNGVIYNVGGIPGSDSMLFMGYDGDTYLIVEIPSYTDIDANVHVTRTFMVSIRATESDLWTELGYFSTDGVEPKKYSFEITQSYTHEGQCQVKVEFYNEGAPIPYGWEEVRVSRIWVDVIELRRRHRNHGMFLELPHDLADVVEGTPFPGNSVYLFDADENVQHVIEDAVAYSAVFQRRYDTGSKTSVHLDNMDIYLYQDKSLEVANNRYYVIANGCSVSQAAGAILSELIRHAGDTNMHISPYQICHVLYDPSVCCRSTTTAAFTRSSTPFSVNIIGVNGSGHAVEARRYHMYKAVKRGATGSQATVYWYKATWNATELGWTLEEVGQGDELMISFWNVGPTALLAIMKSGNKTDQHGDPVYTHDVMPIWVSDYQGGDWYIKITNPSEFDTFAEGATVSIAVKAMREGSMVTIPNSQVYVELFCWYYNEDEQTWGWYSYPGGKIYNLSSVYGTLSEYTTTLDLPADAENYHWGVGVGWYNHTTQEDKYDFVDIVIGDTPVTQIIKQAVGCNLVSSFVATQVPQSGNPSTLWGSYWPDRGEQIFFPHVDEWTSYQTAINGKFFGYTGYRLDKVGTTLLMTHSRAMFEFNLDSTDTSKIIAQASNNGFFKLNVARLIVTPKEVSNYGRSGYGWTNPDDSAYVESNNEGYCGFFVGVFLGYVFDEQFCDAYRAKIPSSDSYDYTRWKGYNAVYSWGVERGWQTSAGITWPNNIPKNFDMNAGCWQQPPCKYPDSCCGPGGCNQSGQECSAYCDGNYDLGSFAYDVYTRRTVRYSPDVNARPYYGMGSDCWTGYNAKRLLTTRRFNVSGRTIQPNSPMVIDVSEELSAIIREFAKVINHADVRSHAGTPGTYRFKVGFWIAPAWRQPISSLSSTTYRDGNNEWQTRLSGWHMYERTVEFYTRHNGGTEDQAPRLLLSYIID